MGLLNIMLLHKGRTVGIVSIFLTRMNAALAGLSGPRNSCCWVKHEGIIPRKLLSSLELFGTGIDHGAAVLLGSAATPCPRTMCPRNWTLCWQKEHLAVFSITSSYSNFSRTAHRWVLCSSLGQPCTSTLSIRHTTPWRSGKTYRYDILR